MRERGVLFSAPMVRALLAGTKTQTRRIVKPQPDSRPGMNCTRLIFKDRKGAPLLDEALEAVEPVLYHSLCPYGQPGDRLWVREAWMPDPPCDGTWGYTEWAGCRIGQIAAVPEQFRKPELCNYRATWPSKDHGLRWTPGIHMPRWASRITLEVTGVRVERLQDISEADAIAEGIDRSPSMGKLGAYQWCDYRVPTMKSEWFNDPVRSYQTLWDSINSERPKLPSNTNSARYARVKSWLEKHPDTTSWDANPWVWVVEFRRIDQ